MNTEDLIEIKKLKDGDRIQFRNGTWAMCSSPVFETDVSNLKGTVITDKEANAIYVKLDTLHDEFVEWDNDIRFDISEDVLKGKEDHQFGTHFSVLEDAIFLTRRRQ